MNAKPQASYIMTPLLAVQIVEGDIEADGEQIRDAWQFIYDSGLYLQLQGWYGRTVKQLLDAEEIQ